jgi:hypothetical protein
VGADVIFRRRQSAKRVKKSRHNQRQGCDMTNNLPKQRTMLSFKSIGENALREARSAWIESKAQLTALWTILPFRSDYERHSF